MKTRIKELEEIKGKPLTKAETDIVNLFGDDETYEFYLDHNGNIGSRRKPYRSKRGH